MKQKPYLAYLVRLWPVKSGTQTIWRASIESVQTGECRNFAGIEGLLTWLWQLTEGGYCQGDDDAKGGEREDREDC